VTLHAGTPPHLVVARTEHGLTIEKHLHREFFNSSEYRRITELARTLAGLIGEGAYVTKGDARHDVANFRDALQWMLDQARKGQSIQRYKGLGEMNPSSSGTRRSIRNRAGSCRYASTMRWAQTRSSRR
jgi:DNA gyrase subunit B